MKKITPPPPRQLPCVQIRVTHAIDLYGRSPETNLTMATSVEDCELKLNNITDETLFSYWEELARVGRECGTAIEALQLVSRIAYPLKRQPPLTKTNGHAKTAH